MARMTTRERKAARADRLREWAEKREAKQAGLSAAADPSEANTGIPFGQPILVGHHSERRHRNAIAKMDRAMSASVDNSQKAASMSSRADEIDRQADNAIYSDDPDAIEALKAKLAALEAKREQRKAANKAYRAEHKAELKEMHPYDRSQAIPFPSYSISNLGGVISSTRKRIAQLEREAITGPTDRFITARWDSDCAECGAALSKGDLIRYNRTAGARCADCKETS